MPKNMEKTNVQDMKSELTTVRKFIEQETSKAIMLLKEDGKTRKEVLDLNLFSESDIEKIYSKEKVKETKLLTYKNKNAKEEDWGKFQDRIASDSNISYEQKIKILHSEYDKRNNTKENITSSKEIEKINLVKSEAEATYDEKEAGTEIQQSNLDQEIKRVGLTNGDLESMPEWSSLSHGQKLLTLEQLAQNTLSRVKKIGEDNFNEKNNIKMSWNTSDWKPFSLSKKIWHKMGKSFYISKEEKQAIRDAKEGKIKPEPEILKQFIENNAEMNLDVVEKDGKASIQFMKVDESLPIEQQRTIEFYNEVAGQYASMPDAWRGEKAANSLDGAIFNKKNHEKFIEIKNRYEQVRKSVLEINGKSMQEANVADYQIAMLQLKNTNPDALGELKRIEGEASWKRLVNNENVWRSLYIGVGYGARKGLGATVGLLAAPLVAGAMGGIRSWGKANKKIGTAFVEGRTTETFQERRIEGKKGIMDDKNAKKGLISKALTGKDVNAKEVAAFVDADSQIQRLDKLMQKLENAGTETERARIISELSTRVDYINQKHNEGLINYGSKNPTGLGYALLKNLSDASIQVQMNSIDLNKIPDEKITIKDLDEKGKVKEVRELELRDWIKEEIEQRSRLLENVMANNEKELGKKQADFKRDEILRGMAVGAGFSLVGWSIANWWGGGTPHSIGSEGLTSTTPLVGTHGIENVGMTPPNLGQAIDNTYVKPPIMRDFIPNRNMTTVQEIPTVGNYTGKVDPNFTINRDEVAIDNTYVKKPNPDELVIKNTVEKPEVEEPIKVIPNQETPITTVEKIEEVKDDSFYNNPDYEKYSKDITQTIPEVEDNTVQSIPEANNDIVQEVPKVDDDITQSIPNVEDEITQEIPKIEDSIPQSIPEVEDMGTEHLQNESEIIDRPTPEIKNIESVVPTNNTSSPDVNAMSNSRIYGGGLAPIYPTGEGGDINIPRTGNITGNGFTTEVPMTKEEEMEFYGNKNAVRAVNVNEAIDAKNAIQNISTDPRHLESASDVRRVFGRPNVVIDKPDSDYINGIEAKEWTKEFDQWAKENSIRFKSYDDYIAKRELQELFPGKGIQKEVVYNQTLDKQVEKINVDYFKNREEWPIIEKIPAKYFFDFNEAKLADGSPIPEEDLEKLIAKGVIEDNINGAGNRDYSFANEDELKRLAKVYAKVDPLNAKPIDDESMEKYISRITRDLHKTNDGTLFMFKKEATGIERDLDNGTFGRKEAIRQNNLRSRQYNSNNYSYDPRYSRTVNTFGNNVYNYYNNSSNWTRPVRMTR